MGNSEFDKQVIAYMLDIGLDPSYKGFEYYQIALTHMIHVRDRYIRRQIQLFKYVGEKCSSPTPIVVARSMERFARKHGYKASALLQKCYLELLNMGVDKLIKRK